MVTLCVCCRLDDDVGVYVDCSVGIFVVVVVVVATYGVVAVVGVVGVVA